MHILLVEDGKLNITDAAPDLSALGTELEGGFLVQIFGPGEGLTPGALLSSLMRVETSHTLVT